MAGSSAVDVVEQIVDGDRRSEADRIVAELLGQVEEIDHAGNVDAIADGGTEDEAVFHAMSSTMVYV